MQGKEEPIRNAKLYSNRKAAGAAKGIKELSALLWDCSSNGNASKDPCKNVLKSSQGSCMAKDQPDVFSKTNKKEVTAFFGKAISWLLSHHCEKSSVSGVKEYFCFNTERGWGAKVEKDSYF